MAMNLFGTDGIRAPVGTSPLTVPDLTYLGHAIGQWLCEKYPAISRPSCIIATDTRISSSFIKNSLSSGLLLHPLDIIDAGIMPTPAACFLAQKNKYTAVFVISASHNPSRDNGIKIIDGATGKIDTEDMEKISSYFYRNHATSINYETFGSYTMAPHLSEDYSSSIIDIFSKLHLSSLHVLLDCAHGATYAVAPSIFAALGAHVTAINNHPTGHNINEKCGSLYAENMIIALKEHGADIGFAFDGDGDRVIAALPDGTIFDGDYILALLHTHPYYHKEKSLVGTILSNAGLEYFLSQTNKKLIRAAVGDKAVAQSLEKENLLLGGEPSGHIIMRDFLYTGDGIFTALRLLEVIVPILSTVKSKLFKKFPHLTINIPITRLYNLAQSPFANLLAQYKKLVAPGRIVMRYSGTEPVLRIMVEHEDCDYAQKIMTSLIEDYHLLTNPIKSAGRAVKTSAL